MADVPISRTEKSTNVRSIDLNNLVRRLAMRAACAVAPDVMARKAAVRFLTPPHPVLPGFDDDLAAGGYRFGIEFATQDLAAWSWGAGPVVILVHGWGGRASQFAGFVAPLVADGFRVVAMDFPAHGESTGRRTNLIDMAAALDTLARRLGPIRGVIAHSMGAPAVAYAMTEGFDAERMVFIAPPADMTEQSKRIAARNGVTEKVRGRMQRRIEDRLGVPWRFLNLPRVGETAAAELLVIHDRKDSQVDWSDGVRIAQAWPGARMVSTSGLGHNRILGNDGIIAEAVGFVGGREEDVA